MRISVWIVRCGFKATLREQESSRLTAFRRSLLFPDFLFGLGLSGHKDERFMVKLEAQDQGVSYAKDLALVKGCGFDRVKGNQAIDENLADLVAYGKLYVSNPDLVERFEAKAETAGWDESTFYTTGAKGYTSYPTRLVTASIP